MRIVTMLLFTTISTMALAQPNYDEAAVPAYTLPDQIKVTVEDNTKVLIEGPDKMLVGKVAAEIRSFYPPEPYKGKGVKYSDETIRRKEGKTVQ